MSDDTAIRARFNVARDALFALECAISPDDTDPHRKAVYRVRVELGHVENSYRCKRAGKP